ncbi:DUF4179 domain-containing protein [Bacillus sp. FJAT-29790]|uniref:DUF4179 domain-containing protein n=1 Tax=Bacillus sp. FJAT-29790 TaxID=1895002 RepID=UPI001C235AD6|nr:DUF4179 domain-containing protein [Bacillus sp. FJAT-29790]MBU8879000.1 DUF4179 domain-containing protein [Bacillus sp. FJAT-29790]
MKDIYELLNDIDIDIDGNEFVEMEVSEFENTKVKKALKKSLNQKKKVNSWKKNVAAAVIIAGLSATTFGLTFPAYAGNIPIIGDIFRFIDNGSTGLYDDYKAYSSAINMTKESKGIKVTINDAIFDGETISLTYSLESDQDLGDDPLLLDFLNIKGANGTTGRSTISRVDKNNYVGLITASSFNLINKDAVNVKWRIEEITIPEKQIEIKGNWNFAFSLKATENNTQLTDRSAVHNGVQVNIGKISVTPMSFIVYFDQMVSKEVRDKWHGVDVDIEIKDDLGNIYSGEGNGGSGDSEGYKMSLSKTFEKLDPNAAKLIITPYVHLYEYTSENYGGVEINEFGEKAISIPKKPGKGRQEFVLDDIIIELKK